MANKAQEILLPSEDSDVLVRVGVLYVGQGSSTVVMFADGSIYKSMLIDINLDSCEGIDVPKLISDLVGDNGLDIFVNSHPHNDHLCGVTQLGDAVYIEEVWHSGHIPGKDDRAAYDDLQALIKKVKDAGGVELEMDGSRYPVEIGEAECHILAPAEHVKDEIDDETEKQRRQRIHEYCAVLKVGKGDTWILIPGDADREAWKEHITNYHKERLPSVVFLASHHGSRSFFKTSEDDEDPYLDALKAIDPEYVIISAPRQDESRHGHPHGDAVELYVDQVGEENVLHTGKDRYSFICDIMSDGTCSVSSDSGELAKAYPYQPDSGGDSSGGTTKSLTASIRTTAPAILGSDGRSA